MAPNFLASEESNFKFQWQIKCTAIRLVHSRISHMHFSDSNWLTKRYLSIRKPQIVRFIRWTVKYSNGQLIRVFVLVCVRVQKFSTLFIAMCNAHSIRFDNKMKMYLFAYWLQIKCMCVRATILHKYFVNAFQRRIRTFSNTIPRRWHFIEFK